MRRIASALVALSTAGGMAAASVAAFAPAAAATSRAAACSVNWGTNAKHRGSDATVATRVRTVRAGQHGCFDRLVIDLSGGRRPPFSAQYVKRIVAEGSGKVLKVRGNAKILIVVRGPAGAHYNATAVNLANVSGFKTFRQVI